VEKKLNRSDVSDLQYCSLCGRELEKTIVEKSYSNEFSVISMRCPKKREPAWWNFWTEDKHASWDVEEVLTILNYDPITGERIKRER